MNPKRLKTNFNSISLFLAIFSFFVVYGCSYSGHDFIENVSSSLGSTTSTRALEQDTVRIDLVNSIAEYDCFLDYIKSVQTFSDKFSSYYSTLNTQEKEQLRHHINNDDYTEDVVNRVNIRTEIELVIKNRNNLYNNVAFQLLNDSEKRILFNNCFGVIKTTFIKTREEGGSTEQCAETRRNADIAATNKLFNDLNNCYEKYPDFTEEQRGCILQAEQKHMDTKQAAYEAYLRCIRGVQ